MIKNDSQNKDNQVLELMYKVLKDRLRLNDNFNDRDNAVSRFEDITKKLDTLETQKFNHELDELLYITKTLEEEKIRLEKLVTLLKKRVDERTKEQNDFYETTGRELRLESIKEAENLTEYQNRLRNINDYLSNTLKISLTESDIANLEEELTRANNYRKTNEEKNVDRENELDNEFMNSISDLEIEKNNKSININKYLSDLMLPSDIEDELDEINVKIREKQNEYDTYKLSLSTLKEVGQLDNEYELIQGLHLIGESLYFNKEQEFILKLFKLISKKENEFSKIYEKREEIRNILEKRELLRSKLGINNIDIFVSLKNTLRAQEKDIEEQKNNIDLIARIEEKLSYKKDKLSRLIMDNERVEILSILQEFGLIKTADVDYEETLKDVSKELDDVNLADVIGDINVKDNQVVSVLDNKLDFDIVYTRAKNVMTGVAKAMKIGKETKKEEEKVREKISNELLEVEPLINNESIKEETVLETKEDIIKLEPIQSEDKNNIIMDKEPADLSNNFELKVDPLANVKPSFDAVLPGLEDLKLDVPNIESKNDFFTAPIELPEEEPKLPTKEMFFDINNNDIVFPNLDSGHDGNDSNIVFPDLNTITSDDNDYINALNF